jgi:hypothetical protein
MADERLHHLHLRINSYKGSKSYKEIYAAVAQEVAQAAARSGYGSEANSADKGKGVDKEKKRINFHEPLGWPSCIFTLTLKNV